MSRLSVELVPASCWYTNVRSNVSRADWEKCKQYAKKKSGDRCEICGGVGSRYTVDTHEIWAYDDERQVQTLVGLIALCPRCHEVKHMGRAHANGNLERAALHLQKVNGWSDDQTVRYVEIAFQIWQIRSEMEWTLDISWLETLGINPNVGPSGR